MTIRGGPQASSTWRSIFVVGLVCGSAIGARVEFVPRPGRMPGATPLGRPRPALEPVRPPPLMVAKPPARPDEDPEPDEPVIGNVVPTNPSKGGVAPWHFLVNPPPFPPGSDGAVVVPLNPIEDMIHGGVAPSSGTSFPQLVQLSARSLVQRWKSLAQFPGLVEESSEGPRKPTNPSMGEVLSAMEDGMDMPYPPRYLAMVSSVHMAGSQEAAEDDVSAIGEVMIRDEDSIPLMDLAEERGLRQPLSLNPLMVVDIMNVANVAPAMDMELIRHIVRWASSEGLLVVVNPTSFEQETYYQHLGFEAIRWAGNDTPDDDELDDGQMVYVGARPADLDETPAAMLVELPLPEHQQ